MEAVLARQFAAAGRVGFDQQRGDKRALFLHGDLHRAVALQTLEVAAGKIEVVVQRRGGLRVHEFVVADNQAGDGAGLFVETQVQAFAHGRVGGGQRHTFRLDTLRASAVRPAHL